MALGLSLVTSLAMSQSIFKPLPKVTPKFNYARAVTITATDSTLNAWRPIANIAAYAEPGNLLMAGVGFGYQHLTWNPSTAKWSSVWSVSGVAFAGGSTAPSSPASVMSIGAMLGLQNNLLMLGPIYNFGTKQIGIAVSVGIDLNN